MPLFTQSSYIADLKSGRFWSLEWVKENQVAGPFTYVILRKREGGGYDLYGEFPTASEAFAARLELVAQHGATNFFLRCRRLVQTELVKPGDPDTREDLDRWRDALYTGDESLIAEPERPEFRDWAARTVESRPAYRRSAHTETTGAAEGSESIPF